MTKPKSPSSGALQAYLEMMRWAENERRGACVPGGWAAIEVREVWTRVIDKARQMAEWTEKQG